MDYLEHTQRITLQLSSLCNYARQHSQCPAHHCKERHILPSAIVRDVIDTAAEWGWDKQGATRLAWHIYNEPMIDPRLSEFVCYARSKLPATGIILWTNGWYLTPDILEHLIDAGVNCWRLTAYSREDRERFEIMATGCSLPRKNIQIIPGTLDNRLSPRGGGGICHAPFRDLCIYSSGHIGLCCMDCRCDVVFADLSQVRFRVGMAKAHSAMDQLHKELTIGKRTMSVCHQCGVSR